VKEEREKRGKKWREREKKRERKRERENVIKCLKTKKDERFNTLFQLSFYDLKIKSK
jgi:hypothetical protein